MSKSSSRSGHAHTVAERERKEARAERANSRESRRIEARKVAATLQRTRIVPDEDAPDVRDATR